MESAWLFEQRLPPNRCHGQRVKRILVGLCLLMPVAFAADVDEASGLIKAPNHRIARLGRRVMRKSVACLSLCFILVHVGNAYGQSKTLLPRFSEPEISKPVFTEPKAKTLQPRVKVPRRKLVRSTTAEQLIQKRALRQAEERRSRIAARQWRGISLMRPTRLNGGAVFYSNHWMDDGTTWWSWSPKKLVRKYRR